MNIISQRGGPVFVDCKILTHFIHLKLHQCLYSFCQDISKHMNTFLLKLVLVCGSVSILLCGCMYVYITCPGVLYSWYSFSNLKLRFTQVFHLYLENNCVGCHGQLVVACLYGHETWIIIWVVWGVLKEIKCTVKHC